MKMRHPNVVKLREVMREDNTMFMVFEYMKENLYEMLHHRTKLFPEPTVRNIAFQVLQGLAYIHRQGWQGCLVQVCSGLHCALFTPSSSFPVPFHHPPPLPTLLTTRRVLPQGLEARECALLRT